MKKILKITLAMMAVLTVSTIFTACNTSDDGPLVSTYTQFATLVADDEQGSTFEVNNSADGPVRTLTSTNRVDTKKVAVGQRLMIAYQLEGTTSVDGSGPIRLLAYMQVINGKVEVMNATEAENFKSNSLQNPVLQVTGNYLNVQVMGRLRTDPDKFALIADKSTMDDKYPTVYLVFLSDDDSTGAWKTIYGSFDISEIWNNQKYNGMIIKMNNETGENEFKLESRPGLQPQE